MTANIHRGANGHRGPLGLVQQRVATYILIVVAMLVSALFLQKANWAVSASAIGLLETVAACLAFAGGVVALAKYYSKKNNLLLFVGVGLLGTGVLDSYLALLSSGVLSGFLSLAVIPDELSSWGWLISRLLFSLMLLLSWISYFREKVLDKACLVKASWLYAFVGLFVSVSVVFLLNDPLAGVQVEQGLVSRPTEFIPAVIFLFALVGYLSKGDWRSGKFEHWLVMSLLVALTSQVAFMPFSNQEHASYVVASHLFKLLSYALLLAGLVASMYSLFRQADEAGARISAVLDNVVDGIITIDERGIIQSLNPAAEGIFGYQAYEIVGENIKLLMPTHYASQHDTYLKNYNETGVRKIIGIGREVEGQRRDGSVFPLELAVSEVMLADQRFYTGVVRDITVRKEAQRELNRFKSTLDETLDCVFMFEPDTLNFFYVNKGAMDQVGYSYDELMSMRPFEIKPQFDEQQFREFIAPMLCGEQTVKTFETIHRSKDGIDIPVEIFLQYVSLDGEPPRFVAIVHDISERKRMERMKDEFVSSVSHELRTPLTSIRGSLALIHGGAVGEVPNQVRDLLGIAQKNTDRLLLLINDILDLTKIESGKMSFNYSYINVADFIGQVVVSNEHYALERQVALVADIHSLHDEIYVDTDRLAQVMANLISNAVKFSESGQQVIVRTFQQQEFVRISVVDEGCGVPGEFQPKLFDKFTQADSSDTRQVGGTGLGLSISKALVENMCGHIGFESEEGKGTSFYVDFLRVVDSA